MIENQTERKIKILRSDNGGEYESAAFRNYLEKSGIIHQTSTAHTPQQNGRAERMNRTIIEKAKCLLFDADLPKSYWAEAINMSAYLINRSYTSTHGFTPEEKFFNKKVNISELKLFGSEVMVYVHKANRRKLDEKAVKMIFVGYDDETKGYRCIDKTNRKLTISRDIKFLDAPLQTSEMSIIESESEEEGASDDTEDETAGGESTGTISSESNGTKSSETAPNTSNANDPAEETTSKSRNDQFVTTRRGKAAKNDDQPQLEGSDDENLEPEKSIKPCRKSIIEEKSQSVNPNSLNLNSHFALFTVPKTVNEAMRGGLAESWKKAMTDEINSHSENETWTLTNLPSDRKAIKSGWVFKLKRDENGNIVKFKARLVAKGYSQRYGVDYEETFSPVVRYVSIRYLLALAVEGDWKMTQMDAITAFLQGHLNEEIYMSQPEGFDDGSDKVCKLNRAVYGLKQASRQWNLKLDNALKNYGLKRSNSDPCIYYGEFLIVAIYVDDFLIFFKLEKEVNKLKQFLNKNFRMKDIGEAKIVLGMRIRQTKDSIILDQMTYVNDILHKFGMNDSKPVTTPSNTSEKLSIMMVTDENDLTGNIPYQEAVGSLLYLAQATRPDISFAVNDVSRFNHKHGTPHWTAVKRIFRYLKGTENYALNFRKTGNAYITAYSDSDFGSDVDKRRSCSGYVVKMANCAISWYSHRQEIIALSSTEAEYIALSSCAREIIWLRQLADELNPHKKAINIYVDNTSTIQLAEEEAYRPRSKHIDIRYHHTRQLIEKKFIKLKYCETAHNVADVLTKAVPKEKTVFCSRNMGLTA